MEPFSPPAAWFWWKSVHHPRESTWKGLDEAADKGLSRINKLKEKIIYFYSLSVDYNNSSPTVSNDSQNCIHCCQQVAIIYYLTKYIVIINSLAWINFNWPYHGSLATVMQDIKLMTEKNEPASRAISMAMRIKRYGAECIPQCQYQEVLIVALILGINRFSAE